MSDPVTSATKLQTVNDSLTSQQFILGCFAMTIVAGTVAAVFMRGEDAAINVVMGFVFGSLGSGVSGFYFGSSKGSQNKDAALAAKEATMTTVSGIPPVVTTTTGTQP